MATDGKTRGRRVTRRQLLATTAAAGIGAAASHWVGGAPAGAQAAGTAAPRRGGTLKIAEIGEPLTLDVVATTADLTSTLTLGIFEELFSFDANWRVVPSLVSSYNVSKDGLTYTFVLKDGLTFHNGAPVTPAP